MSTIIDLSTLSVDNLDLLRKATRENRDENGNSSFMVTWKYDCLQTEFTFAKHADHAPEYPGHFDSRDGIFVQNYGNKQENARYHRGGIFGTLMHEWCHRMQFFATENGVGEWYWSLSHPRQEELHEKYRSSCKGYYAGTTPEEMAAEAFRVLSGCPSGEEWEANQHLLNDWKDFFMNDEVFSLMFANK
jgi:hypothetical protein